MSVALAYYNGRFLPADEISIPVWDAGFVQGVTVAEQLRTFGGRLFRLSHHLQRLRHSLEIVGIDLGESFTDLAPAAEELAAHNHRWLAPDDDLVLSLFVTPGAYATAAEEEGASPTVGMHTRPLPFHLWSGKYTDGQRLMVTDVRQIPAACWPAELKCRSRMHYYLADHQAQQFDPGSRALLLDLQGRVMETSTANVVLYRQAEGLVAPRVEHILPGVSMGVLTELAGTLAIPFVHRDLSVADVADADEVMLCSTSPCLLPVVSFNRRPVTAGRPGPIFQKSLAAWSELVALDIAAQARRFSRRPAA
jgi:branched-subunit amino acid aminotransferase/4-amino-4-deoxychorismate lyase